MELEEYLQGLRNCPDEKITMENYYTERLTAEFGIEDNWEILLKADYGEVIRDFIDSTISQKLFVGKYRFVEDHEFNEDDNEGRPFRRIFEYVPGIVLIQAFNCNPLDELDEVDDGYKQFNLRQFNINLCLHPYQKKKVKGIKSASKVMALVIEDIAQYAMKKKFPLCFPDSVGHAYIGPEPKYDKDFSRIVYYNP